MNTTLNIHENRVKKGAMLLDKWFPNWFIKINLWKLKMDCCYNCILGQLYKDFWDGREILSSNAQSNYLRDSIENGINALTEHYGTIEKYWIKEINKRLNNETISQK